MAINFRKFFEGIGIRPKATSTASLQGELDVTSSDGKLHYHNGTSASPVLTESHAATVTNKTIDADLNTISNIGEDELADDAVATAKIQNNAVTNAKIAAGVDAVKIADGSVDNTEFQALNGVTSNIQGQLNNKASVDLSNLTSPTAINQNLEFDKTAPIIATKDALTGPTESLTLKTGDSPDDDAGTIVISPGIGNTIRAETQVTSDIRLTTADTAIFLRDVSDTYEYAIRPANATEDVLIVLPPDNGANGQALFTDGGGNTYWNNVPETGANTSLSNLVGPTSINEDLVPNNHNSRSLGSASINWLALYTNSIRDAGNNISINPINRLLRTSGGVNTVDWQNSQLITDATVKLDWSGTDISVNTRKITNLSNPTNPQDAATKAYVDSVTPDTTVGRLETPTGAINGSNVVFGPLTYVPATPQSVAVYVDGIALRPTEFSVAGATITLVTAPVPGQTVAVFYLTGGTLAPPPVISNVLKVEHRTISAGEATAKSLTLVQTPAAPTEVMLDVIGGSSAFNSTDFVVSGATLSWGTLGLDGVLAAGDKVRITYVY
jgi:hypothetical protein